MLISSIWKLWVVFMLSETWAWNQRDGFKLQACTLVSCTTIGNNSRTLLSSNGVLDTISKPTYPTALCKEDMYEVLP